MKSLSYPESLMLLALDDDKGVVVSSAGMAIEYAMAGAMLFELNRQGLISIEGEKVVGWPEQEVSDPLLQPAVARFIKTNKVKSVKHWISAIAGDYRKTKSVVVDRLIQLGALEKKEDTLLWIFSHTKYPTDDSRIEHKIRKTLHDQVLGERELDDEGYILLSLIGASKLEKEVFSEEVLPEANKVIKEIMKSGVGKLVSQIVQEIQTAITISITTAVMTSTIVSTS